MIIKCSLLLSSFVYICYITLPWLVMEVWSVDVVQKVREYRVLSCWNGLESVYGSEARDQRSPHFNDQGVKGVKKGQWPGISDPRN